MNLSKEHIIKYFKSGIKEKKDFKVTKSDRNFKLLHPVNHDFFKTCRDKLHWSLSKDENSSN